MIENHIILNAVKIQRILLTISQQEVEENWIGFCSRNSKKCFGKRQKSQKIRSKKRKKNL